MPGAPLGIDTPERGACGFEQASKFARDTLLNQPVKVAPDPTQDNIDGYGRSLLYINVGYSVAVTRAGWAKHYIFNNNPVQKAPEIKAAQANSQQQHVGIWVITNCATPAPAPAPTSEQAPPPPPSRTTTRCGVPSRYGLPLPPGGTGPGSSGSGRGPVLPPLSTAASGHSAAASGRTQSSGASRRHPAPAARRAGTPATPVNDHTQSVPRRPPDEVPCSKDVPVRPLLPQSGGRSFGIKLGPISHNFTRRTTSIDTPGPGGFHHQHGRRSER